MFLAAQDPTALSDLVTYRGAHYLKKMNFYVNCPENDTILCSNCSTHRACNIALN